MRYAMILLALLAVPFTVLAQAPPAPPQLSCEDGRAALATLYERALAEKRNESERAAILEGQIAKEKQATATATAKIAELEKNKTADAKPEVKK